MALTTRSRFTDSIARPKADDTCSRFAMGLEFNGEYGCTGWLIRLDA